MATVNLKLVQCRAYTDGSYPIKLVFTHRGDTRRFTTGERALPEQWNDSLGQLNKEAPKFRKKNLKLQKMLIRGEEILDEYKVNGKQITASLFEQEFSGPDVKKVYPYFQEIIERQRKKRSYGNADAKETSMSALQKYHPGEDLTFHDVDVKFLNGYEDHLRERGLKDTTISRYMRSLRMVFNKAIEEGFVKQELYPFKKYKISKFNHDTQKRALTKEQMEQIKDFEPEPNTKQQLSKDLFLFSYYMQGMNFTDIAQLQWSNIEGERIVYTRQKTGKSLSVKMLAPVKEIISCYRQMNGHSQYIFPILDKSYQDPEKIRARIKSGRNRLNKHLKVIGQSLDINFKLTSYVARHTYATVLKRGGQPVAVISQAMGHKDEKTTQTYLDGFPNEVIDEANEKTLI